MQTMPVGTATDANYAIQNRDGRFYAGPSPDGVRFEHRPQRPLSLPQALRLADVFNRWLEPVVIVPAPVS